MDDEIDIESEEEYCIFRHMHLCRLAFDLVEYKFRHRYGEVSMNRKRIRTSILTGKKFMDELINGSPIVFREHCRMDQQTFSM